MLAYLPHTIAIAALAAALASMARDMRDYLPKVRNLARQLDKDN